MNATVTSISPQTYRIPDAEYVPRHHAAEGRTSAVELINRYGSPALQMRLFYATIGNQPAA